jgi:IS4 transposase
LLILLWFFSPVVDSLRGLQQAATLDEVRKNFGGGCASLGSLSEGVAVFDPDPLKDIAQELFDQLPDADRAAGVVSDEVVLFGRSKAQTTPDHAVRIVTGKATPHRSGGKTSGGSTGPNCDGFLRIATNRLDLPAELIGEIYRLRWMIETFFRMFKQLLGCRHLFSTKPYGVEIQVYCGIIACLLIMLYTGRKPTKRTSEMVCFYLFGWASADEMERHIEALPKPA